MEKTQNTLLLNKILSQTFNISKSEINDDLNPENCPSWDSFNNFTLVAKLQEVFDVNFNLKEVQGISSVRDVKQLLTKHGVIFPKNT